MSDRKIVDYELVGCKNPSDLAREIKGMILRGWQPFGGIVAFKIFDSEKHAYEIYLTQAMVKYENEAKLDTRPHSRACGLYRHDHGQQCAPDCPTCISLNRRTMT